MNKQRLGTTSEVNATPAAKDVKQGPSIVVQMSFVCIIRVYRNLRPNLAQQLSKRLSAACH